MLSRESDTKRLWDSYYSEDGRFPQAPFEFIARFLMTHRPRDRAIADVDVLEVGFGGGSNIVFAAEQGFRVAGVDLSPPAVAHAHAWLDRVGRRGDLRQGRFEALPFPDASFDLAFDRGALTCAPRDACAQALSELRRVLRPGGRLLFNPYSSRGTGVGLLETISVYDRADAAALTAGWHVLERQHVLVEDDVAPAPPAEWRIVLERADHQHPG